MDLKNRDCLGREMGMTLKKGQCEGEPCDDATAVCLDRSDGHGRPHVQAASVPVPPRWLCCCQCAVLV